MFFGRNDCPLPRIQAVLLLATACSAYLFCDTSLAQQGYGSYYGQTVTKTHAQIGTQSVGRYLYDEYFYKRPSVSPYMSLDRLDTMDGAAYQAYVRPELQRREATRQAQASYLDYRKKEGRVGETRFPGATYGGGGTAIMKPPTKPVSTPGAYHNHWYGSWAK